MDGTLVPVTNPSVHHQAFISPKRCASINVQVMVDPQECDLWPGGEVAKQQQSDSFVWRWVSKQKVVYLVRVCSLVTVDTLWEPTSSLQFWTHRLWPEEPLMSHMLALVVECAIGLCKMGFQCLHKSWSSWCTATVVTVMLHNMAVQGGVLFPEEEEETCDEEYGDGDVEVFSQPQRAALLDRFYSAFLFSVLWVNLILKPLHLISLCAIKCPHSTCFTYILSAFYRYNSTCISKSFLKVAAVWGKKTLVIVPTILTHMHILYTHFFLISQIMLSKATSHC